MSKFDKLNKGTKARATVERKGRGRPSGPAGGKSSDPNYQQVTAYVRKDTYRDVKVALLQEQAGREFSDLVEDLLSKWLKARG